LACLGAVLVLVLRSVSSFVKSLSSSVPREPCGRWVGRT